MMTTTVESSRQYLLNHIPSVQKALQRKIILRDLFDNHDSVPITYFNHLERYQVEKGKEMSEQTTEDIRQKSVKTLGKLGVSLDPNMSKEVANQKGRRERPMLEKSDNLMQSLIDPTKVRHLQWGLGIDAMLQNLEIDLDLLNHVEKWDLTILVESLKLVTFLLNIFDEDLRNLYDSFGAKEGQFIGVETLKERIQSHLKLIRDKREELKRKLQANMPGFEQLTGEITPKAIRKGRKVASSTITELLVRNTVSNCQEVILKLLQDNSQVDVRDTCKKIASEILNDGLKTSCKPKTSRPQMKAKWVPRTIAIVMDTASGLAFTGSSQAVCDEFLLFRDAATKINRFRLGSSSSFEDDLDQRSKWYSDLMTPMTNILKGSDSSFRLSLYRQLILEKKFDDETVEKLRILHKRSYPEKELSLAPSSGANSSSEPEFPWRVTGQQIVSLKDPELPKSLSKSHILCWAISGEKFEFIPPCLRCQSLYDTWIMWGMPDSDDDRADCFSKGMTEPSTKTRYESGESFCCAESVAAAKIHISRHGTLSLS